MKALAILALILAGLAVFIPVFGAPLAVLCSALAMLSFRSQPTLSGVVFGLDIVNAAVLSPSLMLAGVADANASVPDAPNTYAVFLVAHLAFFGLALLWRLVRGPALQPQNLIHGVNSAKEPS